MRAVGDALIIEISLDIEGARCSPSRRRLIS